MIFQRLDVKKNGGDVMTSFVAHCKDGDKRPKPDVMTLSARQRLEPYEGFAVSAFPGVPKTVRYVSSP